MQVKIIQSLKTFLGHRTECNIMSCDSHVTSFINDVIEMKR